MIDRAQLERLEEQTLAPYAAKSGRSLGREHREKPHPYRTEFQRDRDRVIHSSAFRRLKFKTQVYIAHEGDYFRTRLTHTMEAAQIARTIAKVMRLNEDLAETLALAHDLGHPPFGHSGEDALTECMKDHGGFEHNLQGLRIVELLENRYPHTPGLNLTFETRESMRKHTVKKEFPVEKKYRPDWSPLLECQIVDWSDFIAYCAHDVDDALKANLVTPKDLEALALWREATAQVRRQFKHADGEILHRSAVNRLIDGLVTDLIENSERRVRMEKIDSPEAVRRAKQRVISFSPAVKKRADELYAFLFDRVYNHYRVVRMHEKAKRFLRELFHAYVKEPDQLPPQFKALAKKCGAPRAVCDYIAGMTDAYAQKEYRMLFSPFEELL